MLPSNPPPQSAYELRFAPPPDPYYDRVEVYLTFPAERTTYHATFYTFAKVLGVMEEQRQSGENCNGLYFVPPSWILLKDLSEATIRLTIKGLMEGGFRWVFKQIDPP